MERQPDELIDLIDVVFVGQLPPPIHGQSLTNLAMVSGTYERIRITAVPMRFSDDIESVGRFKVAKLLRVPGLIWAVVRERRHGRRDVLLYTVGAKNIVGISRDLLVLPFIRPLFRRTVFSVRTGGIRRLYNVPGLRLLARLAYGRADVVIHADELVAGPDDQLPSPKAVAFLSHGMLEPTLRTKNAEPGERARPSANGYATPEILFVGNLYPSKGTHHLIRAGELLAERGHKFEIRFVGAAPTPTATDELLASAERHGIADRVQVIGPVAGDGVWEQLGEADIFCFPTHYEAEAFPRVIVEAMAMSLPVVSTRWRGVPAMVEEGVTGYLVDPDDDVALADRLESLVADPDLARTMGQAGRARFDANYSMSEFEARLERIVLSAVKPGDAA